MANQIITSTFSGPVSPINVSWMTNPFSVSCTLFMVSSQCTFTGGIQYTMDDSQNTGLNSSTWRWIDTTIVSTTTFAGSSQSAVLNLTTPCTYVRANVTTATSASSIGNVEFKVLQGIGY